MKYRTFRGMTYGFLGLSLSTIGLCTWMWVNQAKPPAPPVATLPIPATPAKPTVPAPATPVILSLSTPEIRNVLDQFLAEHGDHGDSKAWPDCIPGMPFHATAVRFPDADHQRWFRNDPAKWSQIRLTQFADGRPDEKWLLKDGRTYKREVLDASGKVTQTERF